MLRTVKAALAALFCVAFSAPAAQAQSQFPSGTVWGNAAATNSLPKPIPFDTVMGSGGWAQNFIVNGDFSQWSTCPLFNCSMTLVDSAFSSSTNYPVAPTVNWAPDTWTGLGTGYGGAVTTRVGKFIDNQTAVAGYPHHYLEGAWTAAPTSGSPTENPGSCAGPDVTLGTLPGCRATYFDTQIPREHIPFVAGKTFTFSLDMRAGRAVTNAVNNGAGLCRLTVESTTSFVTGQSATVYGILGATGCNGAGQITVVDSTHVDFAAPFSGVYSGGDALINVRPLYASPIMYYSLGYQSWLPGQFAELAGGYMTNSGIDGGFYVYQKTAGSGPNGLAISAVTNNGGLCRLTVASTANFTTGNTVSVGSGGAGCSGSFTATVINGTTLDLAASTYTSGYVSGGYVGRPPTHTTIGSTVSDGNISWRNIGFAKGRTYDLYEGQYAVGAVTSTGFNQGAAQTAASGVDKLIGQACRVSAQWTRCAVTINLPAPEYNNAGDYAWSADAVRQLLPLNLYNGNFGNYYGATVNAGIDVIGPLGVQRVHFANLKVELGNRATPFKPAPQNFTRLLSLPFEDVVGYLGDEGSPGQSTGFLVQKNYNTDGNHAQFARRSIVAGDSSVTVIDGDGVNGNPTVSISGGTIPLLGAANTWALAQTFTTPPVFSDAAGSRTALGLGTAAVQAIGTSGATVPLLSTANTWALAQTFTTPPVFTDAAGSRTALGLGTAAVQTIGTSGATVPLLSTANTWASGQTFVAPNLGTPASGVATNLTGLPILTGVSGLGTGVAAALGQTVTGTGSIPLSDSPSFTTLLSVIGNGTTANLSLDRYSADTSAPNFFSRKARGSLASPAAAAAGDAIMSLQGYGYDGTVFRQVTLIRSVLDAVTGGNDLSGYLVLSTRNDGDSNPTERARLTKTGGFNLGAYTSDPGAGNMNVTGVYKVGGSQITCASLSNAGTACPVNIGTSGATIPLLSTANTWASGQVFVAPVLGTPASGDASNLTNVPAGNLAGTVPATVMGNAGTVRAKLLGANLNTTADQAITLTFPTGSTNFELQSQIGVKISNPSISMTTAVCGLWTAAGKTGVTVIGSASTGVAMSGLTSTSANTVGSMINPVVNNSASMYYNLSSNSPANTFYFACSTIQGAPATADVTVTVTVLN